MPAFVDAATKRFGNSVAAIVFYGSCRRVDQPDGLYDLYVILDDYRGLPRLDAMLAAALPPNVYYLEAVADALTRRAKCTVISRDDFARGQQRWFHSYLWGRFCQPVSLAYARDASIRDEMLECLAAAVTKFIGESICLQGDEFDTRALWVDGLRTSYSTELRSEGPDRAAELFATHADFYESVTAAAASVQRTRCDRVRSLAIDADVVAPPSRGSCVAHTPRHREVPRARPHPEGRHHVRRRARLHRLETRTPFRKAHRGARARPAPAGAAHVGLFLAAVSGRGVSLTQPGNAPRIWVLVSDKAGDNAQVDAVVERLPWPVEYRRLQFKKPFRKGKPPFFASLYHVDKTQSDALTPPWPDLVVTIGRRPAMAALWIRRQSGNRTGIVLFGRPKRQPQNFALIVVSAQFQVPEGPNVVGVSLPLMRVDQERLARESAQWKAHFDQRAQPVIAVLVGGATRPFVFDADSARELVRLAHGYCGSTGSLYVTTSRRTPPAAIVALRAALADRDTLYEWSAGASENPVFRPARACVRFRRHGRQHVDDHGGRPVEQAACDLSAAPLEVARGGQRNAARNGSQICRTPSNTVCCRGSASPRSRAT